MGDPRERSTRDFLATLERQARGQRTARDQLVQAAEEFYRWGRIDRRTQHFQPAARSGDAAIVESHDLMHRRVRSELGNNAQLKKAGEALVDLVVGTGVQTFADPFEPWLELAALTREEFDARVTYALESDERFLEWFLDPQAFDVAGKLAGPDMQRLAIAEQVGVGDTLLLRVIDSKRKFPLCYQVIEREQLDTSVDRPAGPNQNKIVGGIELDAQNREVAFHILDAHPYDDFAPGNSHGKSQRVPADRVIHLFAISRPSQSLGISWLHAVGQATFDRDKFVGAEIQSAAKAALLLLVAKLKHGAGGNLGLDDGLDELDAHNNRQIKLGSTPHAIEIGPEDNVSLVEGTRPTNTAESFIGILDHDTAGGAGVSYYTLTGRYDKTNFSSVRAAKLDEDDHVLPIQQWFARRLALPIRREFNALAVALRRIESVTPAAFAANRDRYQRFDAFGKGRDLLDPEAETNAAQGRLRSCLTTLKLECARRGLHWIKVLRQKAMENRVAELLGVVLDFSKGQGGQVEGSTSSSGSRNEQTEEAA